MNRSGLILLPELLLKRPIESQAKRKQGVGLLDCGDGSHVLAIVLTPNPHKGPHVTGLSSSNWKGAAGVTRAFCRRIRVFLFVCMNVYAVRRNTGELRSPRLH